MQLYSGIILVVAKSAVALEGGVSNRGTRSHAVVCSRVVDGESRRRSPVAADRRRYH